MLLLYSVPISVSHLVFFFFFFSLSWVKSSLTFLAQNQVFVKAAQDYIEQTIFGGEIIRFTPSWLVPYVHLDLLA